MKTKITLFIATFFIAFQSYGQELIIDGGFEIGTPSTDWVEQEATFGTPICTIANCNSGSGTGPSSGTFWAWFGGNSCGTNGSLTQTITVPAVGTGELSFDFEAILCDSPNDFVEILIDGVQVWSATGADAACGVLGYQTITIPDIPLTAGSIDIVIASESFGTNASVTNFFIDNVSLIFSVSPGIPTIGEWGIIILGILLLITSLIVIRQQNLIFSNK